MCGIAGIMYADAGRPVCPATLKAMGDAIAHRGPDGEGFFSAPGIGLVHRRLAIIDLAGGGQPMGNEDGSVQVTFNGEIYNFEPLRRELQAKGHLFRTRSDTEVLVHLYEDQGDRLVERLRGMFAFAIWDARQRRLLLARDRLGIKPLYVYRDAEKLLFASELKAILAHPDVRRRVDPAAIDDYFALGMIPGSRSIFQDIRKLPPANVMSVSGDGLSGEPRRYWRLNVTADRLPSVAQWHDALEAKLLDTVACHQIADVPVGAFLSGGMDSSVMVAIQSGLSATPLRTFSIGFREEQFTELPYARQIARQFGTVHAERIVTPRCVDVLDDLTRYFDEPFADPSAIPTLYVSRLARESVKVAISGDGGDEALGGYARYAHDLREAAIRRRLPAWFRRGVLARLARRWPKADWLPRVFRAKTLLTNLSLDPADAYANTLSMCPRPLRRRLIGAEVLSSLDGHDPHRGICEGYCTAPADDPLAGMIAADVNVLLPDDFLVKVDRASMACGLEVRPPLVDHEFLELAAKIPSELKLHGGETKWLLRELYRDRLPDEVTRRRKQGFDMPIDAWLRGPLREPFEASVLSRGGRALGLIDRDAASRLYRRHLARVGRHGDVLWAMLILARWAERYL
jgi:asparagine synthase (glutamine-hydrolysing)